MIVTREGREEKGRQGTAGGAATPSGGAGRQCIPLPQMVRGVISPLALFKMRIFIFFKK